MKYPFMIWCSSAVVLAAMVSSVAGAETRYRVQDLGDLTGPTVEGFAVPNGINDKGEVVGETMNDLQNENSFLRGFLWRRGHLIDLGILAPRGGVIAQGVNNRSVVVGLASVPEVAGAGFRWKKGVMTDIGFLPNSGITHAYDINNRGQIVGDSRFLRSPTEAFLYEQGVIMSLGSLPGGSFDTTARAINDRGEIVGGTNTVNGPRAYLWREGVMSDLGVPTGSPTKPFTAAFAFDINNRGQVVGVVNDGLIARAVVWQKGHVTVLPSLPNATITAARAINERQQIVGVSSSPMDGSVAVIWEHGVPMQLMMRANDPSAGYVTLEEAKGINERGQIIARGFDSRLGFGARAYLLTPVRIRGDRD